TIAGAAIAVVVSAFKDWHQTFWDTLEALIQVHCIDKVIVINHRDYDAAMIAYGAAPVADPAAATMTYRDALAEFHKQRAACHAQSGAEARRMALNGTCEVLA